LLLLRLHAVRSRRHAAHAVVHWASTGRLCCATTK
jgi:hypothetical protein